VRCVSIRLRYIGASDALIGRRCCDKMRRAQVRDTNRKHADGHTGAGCVDGRDEGLRPRPRPSVSCEPSRGKRRMAFRALLTKHQPPRPALGASVLMRKVSPRDASPETPEPPHFGVPANTSSSGSGWSASTVSFIILFRKPFLLYVPCLFLNLLPRISRWRPGAGGSTRATLAGMTG